MSRYSRIFADTRVKPARSREGPCYSRYRDLPEVAAKVACRLCDGQGSYEDAGRLVSCDLCAGVGFVAADTQDELVLFRPRGRDGR